MSMWDSLHVDLLHEKAVSACSHVYPVRCSAQVPQIRFTCRRGHNHPRCQADRPYGCVSRPACAKNAENYRPKDCKPSNRVCRLPWFVHALQPIGFLTAFARHRDLPEHHPDHDGPRRHLRQYAGRLRMHREAANMKRFLRFVFFSQSVPPPGQRRASECCFSDAL